jgi:MoxR-like ATPase
MSEYLLPTTAAKNYFEGAQEQWDKVIMRNNMAKEGFAAAQIAGLDVVCYGYPGTGKTTFADRGHQTLGLPNETVAYIEADPNITYERLLGDLSEYVETTDENGAQSKRTVSFDSKGIITPDTRVIVADEINRLAPLGLNGLYRIMAERKATTRRGLVEFPNLQYLVSTMNPSETRQATFKMPDAMASRHVIGLPFGVNQEDAEATHLANFQSFVPGKVDQIASLDELTAIRTFTDPRSRNALAVENTRSVNALIQSLARKTNEILRGNGIRDGLERQGMQAGRVARALALIRGQETVTTANDSKAIHDAYFYVTSARLGMLASDGIEAVIDLQAELSKAA